MTDNAISFVDFTCYRGDYISNQTALVEREDDSGIQIIIMLRGALLRAVESASQEFLHFTEYDLQEAIKPTDIDWALRHRLWSLIAKYPSGEIDKIEGPMVYNQICCAAHFYNRFLKDPRKVAWFLHPIEDEKKYNAASFHFLAVKLQNYILTQPITADNLGEFVRLAKFLSDRAFGPVIHKLETKNLNVNAEVKSEKPQDREGLLAKIKELEASLEKQTKEIDVTPE